MFQPQDEQWLRRALELAYYAAEQGEVPVGAVLVQEGKIIGEGWNQPIQTCDPTAHAEIVALRQAARTVGNYRLLNTTVYTTLEPCPMCAGALLHARVERLVYAASDPKAGAVISVCRLLDGYPFNHRIEYTGGLCAEESIKILREFFLARRVK